MEKISRQKMPVQDAKERIKNFSSVALGYSEEQAVLEALFWRELIVGYEAGVRLGVLALDRAERPAFSQLQGHPAFVRHLWSCAWILLDGLDASDARSSLMLRCVFPT